MSTYTLFIVFLEVVLLQQNSKINVNRETRSSEGPPPKRLKLANNTQHYYPIPIPDTAEDEESRSRNYSRLKEELAKSKPSVVLKELMMRTYPQRGKWILQDSPCPSVTEILSDYPLLKLSTYVSLLISNNAHHVLCKFGVCVIMPTYASWCILP